MDVVYTLGTGSRCNDLELLYSLRSLRDYVVGIDRVIIVGSRPRWFTGGLHVPARDKHACKEANIMEKLLLACAIPDLSREFLAVHDDHFAMDNCLAQIFPYWHGSALGALAARLKPGNHYRESLLNTQAALVARNLPTLNYDVHVPIIYDKLFFPQIMAMYDWNTRHGFTVKSLYANTLRVKPEPYREVKVDRRHTMTELVSLIKGCPWWSCGPGAMNQNLKDLLAALYPHPSAYE